jgi:hypothetical protein
MGLKYQYCYEDRNFDFTGDVLGPKHHTLPENDQLPGIRNPRSQTIF